MSPLLKKEKQLMSLWLSIYFCREKYKWERHILMYKITWGWSLLLSEGFGEGDPVRMIQSTYYAIFFV